MPERDFPAHNGDISPAANKRFPSCELTPLGQPDLRDEHREESRLLQKCNPQRVAKRASARTDPLERGGTRRPPNARRLSHTGWRIPAAQRSSSGLSSETDHKQCGHMRCASEAADRRPYSKSGADAISPAPEVGGVAGEIWPAVAEAATGRPRAIGGRAANLCHNAT